MRDVLEHALAWHEAGDGVALATVTETWGSAPCPVGSMMAASRSGRIEGSVSGGCVEAAVREAALETLEGAPARLLGFSVSDGEAFSVGLPCGGTIRVFVEPIGRQGGQRAGSLAGSSLLRALAAARVQRRTAVLLTRLADGEQMLLVERAGRLEADIDPALLAAARRAARERRSFVLAHADADWFVHLHAPRPHLMLVGAVHVAQALAPLARTLGMIVSVIDPRTGFATAERFPDVALLALWPDEALASLRPDAHTAIVTLSHEPRLDDPALDAALRGESFYIGALGSRRTQAARRARLAAMGHDEAALARLHGPVGLAIGAIGPEEIALSIIAEIVAVRRQAA